MVEPDTWIPRLTNGERGLLQEAEKIPNYVNPDYEDLNDMFLFENQIPGWSQAPSSNVVIEKSDSPKKNSEVNNAAKGRRYKVYANKKALLGVKFVEPQDEVSTQVSRAPVVIDKSKGKRKTEMEEQTGDSDSEDEEFGESGDSDSDFEDVYGPDGFEDGLSTEVSEDGSYEKGSDDEDDESNDEDYNPTKNDDDYLFDWLTEAEATEGNEMEPEATILPVIEEGSTVTNAQKKKKLNTGEPSSTKAKGTKPLLKSKNDLRKKAVVKAKDMKEKRAEQKAAANATSRGAAKAASNKSWPPKPPNASSTLAQILENRVCKVDSNHI